MRKRAWVLVECDGEECEAGSLLPLREMANGDWCAGDANDFLESVGWQTDQYGDFCHRCLKKKEQGEG